MVHVHPPHMPLGGDYWHGGYEESPNRSGASPVWGVADTQAHPMSYLAFGGGLFAGFPDGDQEHALAWCTPWHGVGGRGVRFGDPPWNHLRRLILNGIESSLGHLEGGYPQFDGWPRFTSTIHQQMHVDWIRRAVEGGLRLMVAHVVDNHLLARAFSDRGPFGDREAVEEQITALRDLCANHPDLMTIADTPARARQIIEQGKLAVVPGIEVDMIGDWQTEEDATDDEITTYLEHLYNDLGVRHVFPIHLIDNALGGASIYRDMFSVLQKELRGQYFEVRDGTDLGLEFRLAEDEDSATKLFREWLGYAPGGYDSGASHANALGLTGQGKYAIREMIRLGMIIDTDHMSLAAVRDTLDIAEEYACPVTAGHTAFQDLAWRRYETSQVAKLPNEYMRTADDIRRIRRLGGLVSVGLNQGDIRAYGTHVASDAAGSSKSWAQAYLYAVAHADGGPVGIGTDMDGLAGSVAPRFGLNACYALHHHGDGAEDARRKGLRRECVDAQDNGVRYDGAIVEYRQYRFDGILTQDRIYRLEERDIWVAIAIHASGKRPDDAVLVAGGKIRNIAKGLNAQRREDLDNPFLGGNTYAEQLAGYLTATAQSPQASDPAEAHRLVDVIARVWTRWQAMTGDNAPLQRSRAGWRDFDINLDGVAHYGMLPDLFQDLRNVGLSPDQLAPLFRSAEGYLRMWERCLDPGGRRFSVAVLAMLGSLAGNHGSHPSTLAALHPAAAPAVTAMTTGSTTASVIVSICTPVLSLTSSLIAIAP